MKSIKLKMTPQEVRGLANLSKMLIGALECSASHVAYINSRVLFEFYKKLEEKLPYFKAPVTITIGLEKMSIFALASSSANIVENLPPYEYMLLSQIVEAIDVAVREDKRAIEAYRNQMEK